MNNKYKLQYVVTPFCGVCKTAQPMVEILSTSLEMPFETLDANHNKTLLQLLKIKQVPAIIVVDNAKEAPVYISDKISDIATMYTAITKVINQ